MLIDAGVEYQGYASDVTRTYPVGGRFEPATRDVYEVVLAAQLAAIGASRPGATLPEVHAAALRVLCRGHGFARILDGSIDEIIEKEPTVPITCTARAIGSASMSMTWALRKARRRRQYRRPELGPRAGDGLYDRAGPLYWQRR